MRRPVSHRAFHVVHTLLLAAGVLVLLLAAGRPVPAFATAAAKTPSDADYVQAPAATTGPWVLADRLSERLDDDWLKGRGVYGGTGNLSIRMNAMMLELHAIAARTGHLGPARQDARIAPLVRFFTTAPVVVRRTKLKRATAQFPHVPAFEAVFTRNTLHASLHPSADAIIMRALAAVWQARAAVALPVADAARMQRVVKAVADGPFYRTGQRAEDQINWNADVASANWVVNRDPKALGQYRTQLVWFADHIVKKYAKGGATVLSPAGSFRYSPQFPATYGANRFETAEYANLVHEALGFYGTARAAGMAPLGHTRLARLQRWSRHVVYGTWTHAGYLNWDSGLSTKRRHIRQYWGFALDSLLRGSIQGGIVGAPGQRAYIRQIAQNGLDLFMRTAWNGKGAFPSATSFGAPNGFHEATQNDVMAPLRFALVGAELALTDWRAAAPGNMFSDDAMIGRLAISTPDYNTAILRTGPGPEGGLEPTRLFDGLQRPLTTLAADAFNGPAPGVRLSRGGGTLLDTQPGWSTSFKAPFVSVSAGHRNTSGQFQALGASNKVSAHGSAVRVSHAFTTDDIVTRYSIRRGKATVVLLRLPVWGRSSTVVPELGVTGSAGTLRRSGSGTIRFLATTAAGAQMRVSFDGIPASARVDVVAMRPIPRAPAGVQQIEIRYRAGTASHITRTLDVLQGEAP